VAHHDVVVVGASAGGFTAVRQLTKGLPAEFPAAVLVALHVRTDFNSTMPEMLDRDGPLPAAFAAHGEKLRGGRIFVAPPNRHLLIEHDCVYLGTGPAENNCRPAIDALFRSAALCCGPRAIGVVLTGTLHDGSSGLRAIKRCGGLTVVQDPLDAQHADMPRNAIHAAKPDHVVALARMPALLARLVDQRAGSRRKVPDEVRLEVDMAARGASDLTASDWRGPGSPPEAVLACPACHGILKEIDDGTEIRYRCRHGHGFTAHSLDVALHDGLSLALASAVRALDERSGLMRRMARDARSRDHSVLARSWDEKARSYEEQAQIIRRVLWQPPAASVRRPRSARRKSTR
jgi:two-component system chemotaxis response regulator CheB